MSRRLAVLLGVLIAGGAVVTVAVQRTGSPQKAVRVFDRRCRGGCTDSALLRVLPGGVSPSQTATGSLSGSNGQAITTTRASNKTCTRSDGTLVTLSSNQPCVELQGLLVEGASTNLVLQSNAFTTTWVNSSVALTQGDASCNPSPDGTNDAWLAVCSSTDCSVRQTFTSLSSTTYEPSIWMRKPNLVSDTTIGLGVDNNAGLPRNPDSQSVPSAWARVVPATYTIATGNSVSRFLLGGLNTWSNATTPSVCLYGAQLEAQPFATSYIPTTTVTVSRAADVVTAGSLAIGTKPSWSADIVLEGVATSGTNHTFETYNSAGDRWDFGVTTAGDYQSGYFNGVTVFGATTSGAAMVAGTKYHVAGYYDGTNVGSSVNSLKATSPQTFTPGTTYATTSIGSAGAFSSDYLNGWISNICIAASPTGCK